MTVITWVLAADGSRARIFEMRGLKLDLQQVEDLRNTVARAADATQKDCERFAHDVADLLECSRDQHRFDRLRLAVKPAFLALLRGRLSVETCRLVYEPRDDDESPDESFGFGAHRQLKRRR